MGGSCRVVWLKGAMAIEQVASKHLVDNGSRFSPSSQMIRIARLRPWPFSSTTVALASCSSDLFPKRLLYISDVRESDLPQGPGSHPFSNCLWPTLRFAFLAPEVWRLVDAGAGEGQWLARLERSQSRAATQEHWPRHGTLNGGGLDTAAWDRQAGTAMFHPLAAATSHRAATDDQRVRSVGGRASRTPAAAAASTTTAQRSERYLDTSTMDPPWRAANSDEGSPPLGVTWGQCIN